MQMCEKRSEKRVSDILLQKKSVLIIQKFVAC